MNRAAVGELSECEKLITGRESYDDDIEGVIIPPVYKEMVSHVCCGTMAWVPSVTFHLPAIVATALH